MRELDIAYLDLMLKLLTLIIDHCPTTELCLYHQATVLDSLNILGVSAFSTSYSLKKACYDSVPWPNLEHLRYIATKDNDLHKLLIERYLSSFVIDGLPKLKGALLAIKQQMEAEESRSIPADAQGSFYQKNTADYPEKYLPGYEFLYKLTDPSNDRHSLNQILNFCEQAQKFNHIEMLGRLALINVIKMVGEFTKFQHMSRKLTSAAKKDFDDVPWETLSDLRNWFSKYIEDSKISRFVRSNVKDLISGRHDALFDSLKLALQKLGLKIKDVIAMQQKRSLDQAASEKFYQEPHVSTIILDRTTQQMLLQNLQQDTERKITRFTEKSKNIKMQLDNAKCPSDVKSKLEKNSEIHNQEIETYRLKSDTFKSTIDGSKLTKEFQENIIDFFSDMPKKLEWKQKFKQLSINTTYPAFEELKGFLEHELGLTAHLQGRQLIRFLSEEGMKCIDQLGELLLGDKTAYRSILNNPNILKIVGAEAMVVYEGMKRFEQNIELRFATSQLITDIYQYLELVSIDANDKFRGFLAHNHAVFETSEQPMSMVVFFEMMRYITDIYSKLHQIHQRNSDTWQNLMYEVITPRKLRTLT